MLTNEQIIVESLSAMNKTLETLVEMVGAIYRAVEEAPRDDRLAKALEQLAASNAAILDVVKRIETRISLEDSP